MVFDSSDIGSKVVTVSYECFTLTYNISVIEAPKHVTKTIFTSELGIGNAVDVPVIEVDDNWTIEISQGSNQNNMAKYYTNGTAIRFYGGNNLLIKPLAANSNYYITKVTITNSGSGPIAVSTGNVLDSLTPVVEPDWEGSKYTLENIDGYRYFSFDHDASSGNIRIAEIEITYEENPAYNSAKEFADWIMGHEGGDITTVDCEDKFLEAMIMWDDLSAGAQDSFMTHADFADAVARIRMWAAANDYDWDVDFVEEGGSHLQRTPVTNSLENALQGTLIIGFLSLSILAGYVFLQKRRKA